MYCAAVPLTVTRCPATTPPPSSLVNGALSLLKAAITTVFVTGRSSCVPIASATLKVSPHASRASRVTARAFTVELPFADRVVGSLEFANQLMLRTNRSYEAVLTPGYLTKSYQLASAVTRVVEKPLTCSETHCERRMSK
jgi:hypothetical protein